jgi:signal transduction histidine kinase
VEVRSQDELGELAASFNQMSADLKRSNQARKQMTADIAHDLRSPLSVILGYAEALADGKLLANPEIFDVMYREAGQLNHLIDDLRTLSLADAGELSLNLQQIAPQELLEDTRRAYQFQAQDKNISLRVEAQASTPRILVDPNRMTQVLGNLVGNALRFTPPGGEIVLGAEPISGAVQISVRDSGTGIDAADLPIIFDRFYRSDQSRSHNGETGLGLAIARSLVEAQGGQITATSKPGETIFLIKFPLHDSP